MRQKGAMRDRTRSDRDQPRRRLPGELGGACGDLGTFLPYAIGAMTVAGLAPVGVLLGFGVFLVGSGLFYGLPIAVQPMKAVRSEEHTSELQSLMRISYAVFCLKKKKNTNCTR